MKLSTKVRYAVRALMELASFDRSEYVPLRKLAESQEFSMKYLEQMVMPLKIAGILQSIRGVEGGYRLAKEPADITIWDIYRVLDVSTELVDCTKSNCADGSGMCSRAENCAARRLWQELGDAVRDVMEGTSLADLAARDGDFVSR